MKNPGTGPAKSLGIIEMPRPHFLAGDLGLLAAPGEGIANLLDGWPLEIVMDNRVLDGQNPRPKRESHGKITPKRQIRQRPARTRVSISLIRRGRKISRSDRNLLHLRRGGPPYHSLQRLDISTAFPCWHAGTRRAAANVVNSSWALTHRSTCRFESRFRRFRNG